MNEIFNLSRDRSTVNAKYKFNFIGNSQKAIAPVLQRYSSGEYNLVGVGVIAVPRYLTVV